jgi:excisionase family DNA binding protein
VNHTQAAYEVEDAARILGVGRTTCYDLIARGKLKAHRYPGVTKKVVLAKEIDAFIARVEKGGEKG